MNKKKKKVFVVTSNIWIVTNSKGGIIKNEKTINKEFQKELKQSKR